MASITYSFRLEILSSGERTIALTASHTAQPLESL
jgi:hypothetical protein